MPAIRLRKMTVVVDEIHHDGGPDSAAPRLRGAVLGIVSNPFAGRFEPDLQPAMEDLKPILAGRAAFYAKADRRVDTSRQDLAETFAILRRVAREALELPHDDMKQTA